MALGPPGLTTPATAAPASTSAPSPAAIEISDDDEDGDEEQSPKRPRLRRPGVVASDSSDSDALLAAPEALKSCCLNDLQVGWVTCDNATSNDGMMDELFAYCLRVHDPNVEFSALQRRIRCLGHVINLAMHAP